MRVIILREKPCKYFLETVENNVENLEYVGFSVYGGKIIHYLRRGKVLYRVTCRGCVLTELLKRSALVDMPRVDEGHIVFTLLYTPGLEKMLRHRIYTVEERKFIRLSAKQRKALRLFAEGGLSAVASGLGISKSAACRLVKRALEKTIRLLG
ncbi:hypothetical protein [Pyrobaculum ferrireducens]|uniref:Bacterio-opsin activator, HTH domain protein n=1 Tax=Pyrobaculum ferrireducens TaxID=1104324 RepID=G7VIA8_9CREN|nr:hypothetical protein [Pyrobaculum ferrireducens]AET32200.1 hypothetical protein P186_0754 [Pyrobaculum ferrireducens]